MPDGTRVIEHAAVPLEQRTNRIELLEDLVIGDRDDNPDYAFYRPSDIDVSHDGRIFVHDTGNRRIQVFDATGQCLQTIGRGGQGPGEITRGGVLTIAGQHVVRTGDSRWTRWTLEGELVGDLQAEHFASCGIGLPDGSCIGSYVERDEDRTAYIKVVRVSPEGEEMRAFGRLPITFGMLSRRSGPNAPMINVEIPGASPRFAVSASGDVYLTPGDEYQMLATALDGRPRWALRVAWERIPFTDEDKRAAVITDAPDIDPDALGIDWPSHHMAMTPDSLHIDGHGHLYVFPFTRDEEAPTRPVDVYDADGERIFSGLIDLDGWQDAAGGFVYRFEDDAVTEETVVVRYRLVEPFE